MRVKICGITRLEDALWAAQSGADAIGLVFYAPSPRYLADLDLARRIALAVGPFVTTVGLFVNASVEAIDQVLDRVPLQLLQFHGDETPDFCQQFARPYLKAIRMRPEVDLTAELARYASASGILLDAYKAGVPGGTGEAFDWARVPQAASLPIVLAGGLTPENIAAAITQTRPYGVDVSGGVEAAPGIKDHSKISALLFNAKGQIPNFSDGKTP